MPDPKSEAKGDPAPVAAAHEPARRVPLHTKILVGLVLGLVLGLAANWMGRLPVTEGVENPADVNANGLHDRLEWFAANRAEPARKTFPRLLFMVMLPLRVLC